jgi:hypothetical protein
MGVKDERLRSGLTMAIERVNSEGTERENGQEPRYIRPSRIASTNNNMVGGAARNRYALQLVQPETLRMSVRLIQHP